MNKKRYVIGEGWVYWSGNISSLLLWDSPRHIKSTTAVNYKIPRALKNKKVRLVLERVKS